jgi:hypothetical protein
MFFPPLQLDPHLTIYSLVLQKIWKKSVVMKVNMDSIRRKTQPIQTQEPKVRNVTGNQGIQEKSDM